MTPNELNQTGFIIEGAKIEELTYRKYLWMYGADETTSPNGVAPRLHIRGSDEEGWELWSWGVGGNNPRDLETYDTEEEAELAIYEAFEHYVKEHNWDAPQFFDTKEGLIEDWANVSEKPIEVIERYVWIKEAAELRAEQMRIKQEKKRIEMNARIEAESALLTPDQQLIEEWKAVYDNPTEFSGNEKSKALSSAFVIFLNRANHAKIESDFWKVFRIVNYRIMRAIARYAGY